MASGADALKAEGNAAFSAGDFARAIDAYGRALEAAGGEGAAGSHVLLSNRSAAYLARGLPGDALAALSDANAAIRSQSTFAKAYGRKGAALMALRQYEEALSAYSAGVRHDSSNSALREGVETARAALLKQREAMVAGGGAAAGGGSAAPAAATKAAAPGSGVAGPAAGGSGGASGGAPGGAPGGAASSGASSASGAESSSGGAGAKASGGAGGASGGAAGEDPMAAFFAEIGSLAHEVEEKKKALERTHAPIELAKEPAEGKAAGGGGVSSLLARAEASGSAGGVATSTALVRNLWAAEDEAEAAERKKREEEAIAAVSSGREYELKGEAAAKQSAALAAADLGAGEAQAERLTGAHHTWLNLNPFEVLQLPHSCTEDDIRTRYKRLSTLVHPDKCGHAKAGDAFQTVKAAHDALLEPNRRRIAAGLVHNVIKEVQRERRRREKRARESGNLALLAAAGSEAEEVKKETRKAFAEVEHRRKAYEARVKAAADREAAEVAAAHEAEVEAAKADTEWAKGRDARKEHWHSFETGMNAKRRRLAPTQSAAVAAAFADGEEDEDGTSGGAGGGGGARSNGGDIAAAAIAALEEEERASGAVHIGGIRVSDSLRFGPAAAGRPAGAAAGGGAGAGGGVDDYKRRWR